MTKGAAAASSSSADKQVEERRLRPIYEWLDNGNNKKALQESERVLKKQPDLTCAKALMALALQRMGRTDEAEAALDKVMAENPTRDDVLQAVALSFKELNQPEKVCAVYENAVGAEPRSEELLTQLFMSYVRLGYYKKQQSCAMQLYRAAPKNPYYFWSVMSLVLQAGATPDEKVAATVMLPLAERMVAKLDKDGKMEQEQETHIYLMILEMQHKFKEALAVLDGPLGRRLDDRSCYVNFVNNKRMEYMKKLEMWTRVNRLAKKMLKENPDEWSLYQDYITSVFHLIDAGAEEEANNHEADGGGDDDSADLVDRTLRSARAFVLERQEDKPHLRGPFLGEIELKCRAAARRDDDEEMNKVRLVDLLVEYFGRFGTKPVCFSDLKLFLTSLEGSDEQREFLDRSGQKLKLDQNGAPVSLIEVHRHVCLFAAERFLGLHADLTPQKAMEVVDKLQKLFFATQEMASVCTPNELRPVDMYLVLAGHVLWTLWTDTGDDVFFWKAVVPLEFAIRLSPADYHIRFILIKFYNHAGAVGCAQTVYAPLDLKHIQLDSMSHVIWRHVFSQAHFQKAAMMCASALKFFTSNYKETVDFIVAGYRSGSFAKIKEFIALRERVAASQHYKALAVERILLDLLFETAAHEQTVKAISYLDIDPSKDDVCWKELTDNRDFQAMVSFEPPERSVSDEVISENFLLDQRFLRLRVLSCRAVVAAVQLASCFSSEDASAEGVEATSTADAASSRQLADVLADLAGQLEEHCDTCEKECAELDRGQFLNPIQGPDRPRLMLYVGGGHHRLLLPLVKMVLAVSEQKAGSDDGAGPACERAAEVSSSFRSMSASLEPGRTGDELKEVPLLEKESAFERMVNVVEAASFVCVMCGVCHTMLKGGGGGKGKKGKKKRANNVSPKLVAGFNEMLSSLQADLESVHALAEAMSRVTEAERLESASLERAFSKISVGGLADDEDASAASVSSTLDLLQVDVAKGMDSSQQYTLWQLEATAKAKLRYLAALRL